MTSVKVAVRVRPFNQRERSMGSNCILEMDGTMTKITDPSSGKEKKFYFDYSYWSHDGFKTDDETGMLVKDSPSSHYASQQQVFDDLGISVLDNAWEGYHTCLFAYGQTGSGKSYSIVGYGKNEGVIPMACREIFRRITDAEAQPSNKAVYEVTICMLEIYNEHVHDLFQHPSKRTQSGLKVREDKGEVFVDGLTKIPVNSYEDIEEQINMGTSNRTIGSTNMNATSSRAHTVTTISFKQTVFENGKPLNQKRSDINLVDLAGSERQKSTGASGERLQEGSNINKSLSFLGKCISILAEKSTGKGGGKAQVVPYRESKLTRILQNALGGNSKTSMIAALSPASVNYDETLSTLRYANQVKAIKNDARVNESAHDKLIRELKEENERLKSMIENKGALQQENALLNQEDFSNKCYLLNINEDPLLTGHAKQIIEDGPNRVGKAVSGEIPDIKIGGIGVSPDHCTITYDKSKKTLTLTPNKANPQMYKVILNGELVDSKVQLAHGDGLLFGNHNLFTVVMPGMPIRDEMTDYDTIMATMMKDTLNAFAFSADDEEMKKNMAEMRKKAEEEKKELEERLKQEQKRMVEEKKKLTKEMEQEKKRLLDEMKTKDKNSEEMQELREQLKKQQEEAERLKDEQRKKAKEFQAEKEKALKQIEDKKREDHRQELEMAMRKDLEFKLVKLIPMLNEANGICQTLGRSTYLYEPYIDTEISTKLNINSGGHQSKISKLCVKAYPDFDKKDIYNKLSFEEFEDKLYQIREKWENVQYSLENGDEADIEMHMEADQNEAEIFGMMISNQDKLIGNAFIFCDSLSYLLDSKEEWATILNFKGDTKGKMKYSLKPTAYDERGEKLNLVHYENIGTLTGHTLQVELIIHEIEGLPEKYCNDTYCSYNWVDEAGEHFETEKYPRNKNPKYNYKYNHDLFVSSYLAENLQYSILMIGVYGRLSDEKMQDYMNDLQLRPHTQALLKDHSEAHKNEPFYEDKGNSQDIMRIDEHSSDDEENTGDKKKEENDKKVKELEKKLKKLQKENEKLKKGSKTTKKDSSCCHIF